MNVRELIEELKKIDGDRIVVMAIDAEGNGHGLLSSFWECSWNGEEVGLEKLIEEDVKQGYSDDDVLDGEPALCLYP